ncbi:MAG: TIGR02680 family protein [Firmicutes bacterium]|nr:TIGR02680 family protein [Bacillota bacterium]MDY5857450.1 TIGR02680 family protein [Anaerovoracaceae bacterium]
MHNRWKMNRMGFVNFWLYDEEIFDLCDGKILLRGQNGAGKSIATQSFIPFILDGDRTPRRLDPFGSSDRRMEYYFLGDGEKEESTGYLFLEFRKPETEQYRTICIGQRAQKGKPMSFWGFVLLDGRRIGYDLQLYQQVGSTKIPYSKQDMKKVLGEDVPFTDVQGEYKAMVNKYLFGFPRMDQYEQYIQLLVKVRAPKLSKEFRPKKVYEILNDSLQTLTDEELRAMVEAMEKMDSIQGSLEDLRRALHDTQIIRNEYTRYNQYFLAKKGEAYLTAKEEADGQKALLENRKRQMEELRKRQQQDEETRNAAEERSQIIAGQLESLQDMELESAADRRMQAAAERQSASENADRMEEKLERSRQRVREFECNLRDVTQSQELNRDRLVERLRELDELQETACLPIHETVLQQVKAEQCTEGKMIRAALKERKAAVSEGLCVLREQNDCNEKYDAAAEYLQQRQREKSLADSGVESAVQTAEQYREQLIEAYYQQSRQFEVLQLDSEVLMQIEKKITAFEGEADGQEIRTVVDKIRDRIRAALQKEQVELEHQSMVLQKELAEKKKELQDLLAKKDIQPQRKDRTEAVRRRLREAGIPFAAFFEAVEFSDGLSETAQNLLEAQLSHAGVLDALVVSDRDWMRIQTEFSDVQDVFLRVRGKGGKPFGGLTVSESLPDELKQETERILRHICTMMGAAGEAVPETEEYLYLDESGVFRNGVLCGVSCGEDAEGFIGVLARARKRKQMEAKLQQEIDEMEGRRLELTAAAAEIRQKLDLLQEEYESLPDFSRLCKALEQIRHAVWEMEQVEKQLRAAQEEEDRWKSRKTEVLQRVLAVCRNLPYSRSIDSYLEAEDALEEYSAAWENAAELLAKLESLSMQEYAEESRKAQEEETIDEISLQQSIENRKIKKLDAQIQELDEFLNRPENQEKASKITNLKKEKQELEDRIGMLRERLAVAASDLTRLAGEQKESEDHLEAYVERENVLREYFAEELDLKLVLHRENRTLEDCARAAQEKLRDSDKEREASELTAAFMGVYHKYNGSLINYGTALTEWFDGEKGGVPVGTLHKRHIFTAVWNGKKIGMEEFHETLKKQIAETELLIQQKDRELFEDILSRTLSQQLTDRIAESRRWVASMSELMKNMDTSMGLRFSLDWKPRSAESEEQLDTGELEKLLLRDRKLMTSEDMERVAAHFRSKIRQEKLRAEEADEPVNYMDLVRDALDYRKWFEFQMSYYRGENQKKTLTDSAFNKFSGGEKAMAMYVPLLAALNAQYQKAAKEDHPRIVAMDEAFAGVDDKNISSMFELVGQLDFDYIMNSQSLWGCYETVPALRISEMHRPANSQIVTIIHYTWNGRERVLDV